MKRTKKRGQKITWSGSRWCSLVAWQWCCGNGAASNVGERESREIEVTVLLFPSVLLSSLLPCFSHFYHLCFFFFFSISFVFSVHFSLSVFVSFVVLSFLLFFSLYLSPLYSFIFPPFSLFFKPFLVLSPVRPPLLFYLVSPCLTFVPPLLFFFPFSPLFIGGHYL